MKITRLRTQPIALAASLCAATLLLGTAGCSKDKESLLVVALTADASATGLTSVVVGVPGTNKTFALPHGLSNEVVSFGVYVPGNVTGSVTVTATATGGGLCYRGTKATTITSAGATVPVAVTLTPASGCDASGAGGVGGTGAAGSSASGAAGSSAAGTGGGAGAAGGSSVSTAGTSGADGGAGTGGNAGTGAAAGTAGGAARGGMGGPDGGTDAAAGTTPAVLAWSAAENIEKDVITPSYWPRLTMDSHGHVLVGWTKNKFPAVRLYNPSTKTWSATKTLDNRGEVQDVEVAMDDVGHALAVWYQLDNNDPPVELKGIWFAHSEDGGATWSAPARIHSGPTWGDLPIAMAADGSARVAWDETDGTTRTLWSASYDPATKTFTGAAAVKLGSDSYERHARLAMSPSGRGILSWVQRDASLNDSVWASTFATAGGALTTPVLLEAYTGGDVFEPSPAISADGTRGIVIWDQYGGPTGELWANEWTTTAGWAGEKKIIGADVGAPTAAIDKNYTVTIAWTQAIASGKWNVVAARKAAGQPWGTTTPLETTNQAAGKTDEYPYPQVQADAAGNVHVLWRRRIMPAPNNTFGVFVRRFSNNTWQPEVSLGTKTGMPAIDPHLFVAPDGRAAATFFYSDPDATGDADAHNVFVALFK